jgi:hypothetical protein
MLKGFPDVLLEKMVFLTLTSALFTEIPPPTQPA